MIQSRETSERSVATSAVCIGPKVALFPNVVTASEVLTLTQRIYCIESMVITPMESFYDQFMTCFVDFMLH